jgi:hypothetical protein
MAGAARPPADAGAAAVRIFKRGTEKNRLVAGGEVSVSSLEIIAETAPLA